MATGTAGNSRQAEVSKLGGGIALGIILVLLCGAPRALAAECPNEVFRTGPSAFLTACRAYELVTPADSNGRLVQPINTWQTPPRTSELFPTELAAPSGNSFVFMTYQSPLAELRGAIGVGDIYEASRGALGWNTETRLGPSGFQTSGDRPGGVSSDHSYATALVGTIGPLAVEGQETPYLFGREGFVENVGIGSMGTEPFAQTRYLGAGGEHIIFSTGRESTQSEWCFLAGSKCKVLQLEEDAPPTGTGAIYDRSIGGSTHVISLLPGHVPLKSGEKVFYVGNSKDASTVAFDVNGALYARVHNGNAGEEATVKVVDGSQVFAGISDDGRYLFYVTGGENGIIHRFDTTTKGTVEVNPGTEGEIVNVSSDGSHVYFISLEVLTGDEENQAGESARPPARGSGVLHAASGTGTLSIGSATITDVATNEGEFETGMEISGTGLSPETIITEVTPGTLTLSKPATQSRPTDLFASSKIITGVSTSEGEFQPGMVLRGVGIPKGTTIANAGSGTLSLTKAVTQGGAVSLVSGFPNVYVWSEGLPRYVATVASSDLVETSPFREFEFEEVPALTRWTSRVTNPHPGGQGPGADSSRTTPEGTVLVFESRAQLTPYDNGGETEIYRYDDENGEVVCVSCNLGHPPNHGARLQELRWATVGTVIHNLSEDGKRVFFETEEPLVARDTDGVNDIYEWQEGGGARSVDLISSGQSAAFPETSLALPQLSKDLPPPNVLIAATPSGDDVAFLSRDVLAEGAPEGGATAIYDARVGGGFAPQSMPESCAEEGCKPDGVDSELSPAGNGSESLHGTGNVRPRKHSRSRHKHHRRRCRHLNGQRRKKCRSKDKANRSAAAMSVSSSAPASPLVPSEAPKPSPQPASMGDSQVAPAGTEFGSEYGFEHVSAQLSDTRAGAHPDFSPNVVLNHFLEGKNPEAIEHTEEVKVSLPPGLLGNPSVVDQCKTAELLTEHCPLSSQVGIAKLTAGNFGRPEGEVPIYNLVPAHPNREVARFGFLALGAVPAYIDVKVRTAGDYGVTASVYGTSGFTSLIAAETILWGNPSDQSHDLDRLPEKECESGKYDCEVPRTEEAFMTNPAACQSMNVAFNTRSYQIPDREFTADVAMEPITDCIGLPFAPAFKAEPTSHVAGAPTGLKTELSLPQHLMANERATATMREARVTLPADMQVAAGAANWIGTCSESQVGFHEEVDTDCPDNSKLGTATITSPALPNPIQGTIYQRSPLPGHQLGLWLTSDALGMHIKLPGELEPDKNTGRLTAVFRDLPQVPVEEIDLDIWGGPRAPLQNPDHCGTFTTDFTFAPHSNDPAVSGQSQMQITEGCNQGFSPTLHAGVTEPSAGKYSPFVFDLTRPDGDQALRGFELKLPKGELAKIKGVPLCPDADAAAATCPAGSRIGSLQATAGPGPEPFTIPAPGKAQPAIYLSGPYQGAPFSIVSEVPAQAGPFDLGVLAVRSGLDVEPETGRAVVKADPLPQFFEGVGIAYRHLHAVVDRPEFNLNPTNCSELAVTSDVTSTQGTVAHPQARFQVDGCKALKFAPKLSLRLRGGTKRAQYPALTAVLKARKGDANIAFTSVALPHSEFLAQEHIGTICTRKQFAVDKCPKGSVYGKAKAYTPLLDKPLSGPVYLRSSNHPLPDLVAKLGGQLEIDLVGRIDSVHGGIRTTFESVPDAPVSKFVLHMKGGAKSLLTNSTDICRGSHKATVAMRAQNGRRANLRPVLQSSGCGQKKLGKHKNHH